MGLRQKIRSFFGFSRAQTNGFVALVIILAIVLFSEPVYHAWISNRTSDFWSERKRLDSLTAQWEADIQRRSATKIPAEKVSDVRLFKFNPNLATKEDLIVLGFSDRLTKGLINFRNKGGKFRVKNDLRKLYGMDSIFFQRLFPFIQLPETIVPEKSIPELKKKAERFSLNRADTVQFQSVYGVGPVLARRIVKYRERLGGFHTNEQLYEVYGLDSSKVEEIAKNSFLTDIDSLKKTQY